MKAKNKTLYLIISFVLFILLVIWAYRNLSKNQDPAKDFPKSSQKGMVKENEDKKIEDLKLLNSKNEEVSLKTLVQGKPSVVNFWASWCGVCNEEMPDFEQVFKEKNKDVNFVMINLTDGKRETEKTALESINKNNFSFPVYYDKDLRVSNKYEIYAIPTTFFVDSKGVIVEVHSGLLTKNSLTQKIKNLK